MLIEFFETNRKGEFFSRRVTNVGVKKHKKRRLSQTYYLKGIIKWFKIVMKLMTLLRGYIT